MTWIDNNVSGHQREAAETFVWMNGWDRFQTFQTKRGKPWAPPWIKNYPALLDEPAYLDLSPQTRCLLEGLWKLFARTRGTITRDTRRISRQLNQRVTEQQLESLNHAGWLDFCSGTVLEQRRFAFWNGSALEVEVEKEEELRALPSLEDSARTNVVPLPTATHELNGKALVLQTDLLKDMPL